MCPKYIVPVPAAILPSVFGLWGLLVVVGTHIAAGTAGTCVAYRPFLGPATYNCQANVLQNKAVLLWTITDDGKANFTLEKSNDGGWLALGFPAEPGKMFGAHVLVAKGAELLVVHLNSAYPPFPELSIHDLRVNITNATSVVQGNKMILTISGALVNKTDLSLVFALHNSCAWPCQHSSYGWMLPEGGHAGSESQAVAQPTALPEVFASFEEMAGGLGYTHTMGVIGDKAFLHWTVKDENEGVVDLAIEKPKDHGWIALGFPKEAGEMVGAHAVVADGAGISLVNLTSQSPPFPSLNGSAMRIAFANASCEVQGGKTILRINGARLELKDVRLVFALRDDCSWPCKHAVRGYRTMDLRTVDTAIKSQARNQGVVNSFVVSAFGASALRMTVG